MKELGVNPSECAFVGDSDADIQVAINSGAYPVGVLWGFRAREELEKTGAKALAENAEELKNILL
jgi:phosphoglycolate phosphatase